MKGRGSFDTTLFRKVLSLALLFAAVMIQPIVPARAAECQSEFLASNWSQKIGALKDEKQVNMLADLLAFAHSNSCPGCYFAAFNLTFGNDATLRSLIEACSDEQLLAIGTEVITPYLGAD
ncbi:hypothetical protein [Paracoccus actinidiae]|uniref:hypothetical protein n=1 Tax=Paracoccus actinidiae TaxID=3064531 RepID=UPI0027D34DF6|nr:hypothetical protein [Paracoccus sp. M09]